MTCRRQHGLTAPNGENLIGLHDKSADPPIDNASEGGPTKISCGEEQ
jgi:hypothetical protein